MIEHTYIELFGYKLADPLTFVSDLLMTVVAYYCGHKLYHSYEHSYGKYLGLFFFFLGTSSLIGGTCHLLNVYFGRTPHLIAWFVQGVSMLFVELASVKLIAVRKVKHLLRFFIYGFFAFFVFRLLEIRHFDVVKVNTAIAFIGFASGIHLVKYYQLKEKAFLFVPLSILLYILPAIVHGFDMRVNAWINQNVVSHLILLPCYFLLYKSFDKISKDLITSNSLPIQQEQQQV